MKGYACFMPMHISFVLQEEELMTCAGGMRDGASRGQWRASSARWTR